MNPIENAHGHKNGSDLQGAKDHAPQYASTPEISEVAAIGRQLGNLAGKIMARGDMPTPDEQETVLALLSGIRDLPGHSATDALVTLCYGMQMLAPLARDLPEPEDEMSNDPLATVRMAIGLLVRTRDTLAAITGVNSASITGHFRPN